MDDLLKYAVENGIINLSQVQEQIEMDKRKNILEKHPYSIWEGTDGKWHTYLPDEEKGRVPRKRGTKQELEDLIVKFYKIEEKKTKPKTFDESYWSWRKFQDEIVDSPNTPVKYDSDYKRYFQNTEFSRKYTKDITSEDVQLFMKRKIKELSLCKKAAKTLFGYINRVITSARINGDTENNPIEFLRAKDFYKYCTERKKKTQIITEDEIKKLNSRFADDHEYNPFYIPTYAVEFSSLTGMRVGEISALKWENIYEDFILIDSSEKYDRSSKEYFIDKTKNGKERKFPLTEQIKNLLKDIKKAEIQAGYFCEWVFANENGRIHAPVISSCMKNKCRQEDIEEKGIHSWRKTVNSKMKENGVSTIIAASLLGHSEEVNERYYTFDTSSIDKKREIISSINENIRTCV